MYHINAYNNKTMKAATRTQFDESVTKTGYNNTRYVYILGMNLSWMYDMRTFEQLSLTKNQHKKYKSYNLFL